MTKRVLICDDSMLMRKMVSETLLEDGWEIVAEAETDSQAVDLFHIHQPDVVTMDIVMPEMTGLEALIKIRETEPDAKIVMVSAVNQTHKISEAIRGGAFDFIVKPFLPEILQETLDRCQES